MNGTGAAFAYVVGLDPTEAVDEQQLAVFDEFYSEVHLPEVVARNPGFTRGQRYLLSRQDPRHDVGPEMLAVYDIANEAAAERYVETQAVAGAGIAYTPSPVPWDLFTVRWRLVLRARGAYGDPVPDARHMFMVGLDAGSGAPEAYDEMARFHGDVHVPEVMTQAGFQACHTYEVTASLTGEDPLPRLVATYRADDDHAAAALSLMDRQSAGLTPAGYSDGPEAWQRRQGLWRLRYGTVAAPV
jgi:hypothetical protein